MVSFVKQTFTNLESISMYTYISLCGRIQIGFRRGYVERGEATRTNNYISKHGADRSNITDHYQNRLSCKFDDQ